MQATVRTGGCLCGAVRYSVRGEPVHVGRCHCADCRKESGSAFTVYGQWPVDACEITGEVSSYEGRGFCGRCGSPIFGRGDAYAGLTFIKAGTLDDPSWVQPALHIWCAEKQPWVVIEEDVQQVPGNPG